MDHWSAPDDRLLLVLLEEAHGHHFDAEPLRRREAVVVSHFGGLGDLHSLDHVGAVDVHVQDADAGAVLRQCDREVDGHRGLADAALAAVDADLRLDAREARLDGAPLLELALHLFDPGAGLAGLRIGRMARVWAVHGWAPSDGDRGGLQRCTPAPKAS